MREISNLLNHLCSDAIREIISHFNDRILNESTIPGYEFYHLLIIKIPAQKLSLTDPIEVGTMRLDMEIDQCYNVQFVEII